MNIKNLLYEILEDFEKQSLKFFELSKSKTVNLVISIWPVWVADFSNKFYEIVTTKAKDITENIKKYITVTKTFQHHTFKKK